MTRTSTLFTRALAVASIPVLLALAGAFAPETDVEAKPNKPRRFQSIFEPSGAQMLPDGRVLVVGDESESAFKLLHLLDDDEIEEANLKPASMLSLLTGGSPLFDTEDLEGIDIGPDGYVYAITSHSRTEEGRRDDRREKLIRFRIDGDRMVDASEIGNLRKQIGKAFPALKSAAKVKDVKDDNGLNVEGLSFDRSGKILWIALRTPVIKKDAVILQMLNPVAAFTEGEKPEIGEQLIRLDLDGGGIRAITYDAHLDGFLILSRREDKKGKAFKLWLWDGDANSDPARLDLEMRGDLDNAEGITPVVVGGTRMLLIVFDDGIAAKDKGGHYILLDYASIEKR